MVGDVMTGDSDGGSVTAGPVVHITNQNHLSLPSPVTVTITITHHLAVVQKESAAML